MENTTFKTELVRIKDIKAGDVLCEHGARFRALHDAKESQGHRPLCTHIAVAHGPADCAYVEAEWIDGAIISGYFGPGKKWRFQGSRDVTTRKVI